MVDDGNFHTYWGIMLYKEDLFFFFFLMVLAGGLTSLATLKVKLMVVCVCANNVADILPNPWTWGSETWLAYTT